MDARRKLAEQISGLEIRSATTVRDFVTECDHIEGLVSAVVVDAVVTSTRFTEDTAVVTIVLPGARVWDIVGDELRRQGR